MEQKDKEEVVYVDLMPMLIFQVLDFEYNNFPISNFASKYCRVVNNQSKSLVFLD